MILCLWSPLHPLSKLLAIQDHTQNLEEQLWMGGRREFSIIFYRPVTRSDLKQELVVFLWKCLVIFATGCSFYPITPPSHWEIMTNPYSPLTFLHYMEFFSSLSQLFHRGECADMLKCTLATKTIVLQQGFLPKNLSHYKKGDKKV